MIRVRYAGFFPGYSHPDEVIDDHHNDDDEDDDFDDDDDDHDSGHLRGTTRPW